MYRPYVTSVADAIPFDPDSPNILPTSTGYKFQWNPTTQFWEISSTSIAHRQVWLPEVTNTTLNGYLYLDNVSHSGQVLTGTSADFSIILPDATTMEVGFKYEIYNSSTQPIGIYDKGNEFLFSLAQTSIAYIYLHENNTSTGTWISWQILSTTPTASGIVNYKVSSSTIFSTTSSVDVIIPSFSVTPEIGTYAVWFSSDTTITANNAKQEFVIYRGTSSIEDSRRTVQGVGNNFKSGITTMSVIYFNGIQTCNVYTSITSKSISIGQRTLLLIRLGV